MLEKPPALVRSDDYNVFGTNGMKDSFLGNEWVSVLLEDSVRFQGTGKLGLRGVDPEYGEMAWVEPAQLEYGYPALHELVVNVHALTFELNLKDPRLRLSHPFRGEGSLRVKDDR